MAQFTDADLTNAITIAKASTQPQAPLFVSCWTFIKGEIEAPAQPTAQTVGLATAVTLADLDLSLITSAALQVQYATACGPLNQFIANQGMSVNAQIAALAALIVK